MTITSSNQLRFPTVSGTRQDTQRDAPRSVLRAATKLNGSAAIVSAGGEVDASNVSSWANLLGEAAKAACPPGPVVVDVRDMDFLACCAFAALARQAQHCRRRGVALCLVSHQPAVARTVAICGLRWVLPIHPTVEAALSRSTAGLGGACRARL